MKIIQLFQTRNMVTVLTFVLLVTSLVPTSAAETEYIEEGYETVWSNEMNITVYFPNAYISNLYGVSKDKVADPTVMQYLQHSFSDYAERDVKTYYDSDRGMIAAELMISWSTDSRATSFAEYKQQKADGLIDANFHLSTTDNDSLLVVDAIPDTEAVEGDVSRSGTDLAGSESQQYKNSTEIDVTTATIVDFTDYNHSSADWLELNQFKMNSAANATVTVGYAFSNGTVYETVSVLNTDQFISITEHYIQLPMPTLAAASYVAKLTFDDIQVDNWRLYKFAAEYENDRSDFSFTAGTASLALNAFTPFTSMATKTKSALTQFKTSKSANSIAQKAIGFIDVKKTAISASATALGTKATAIVDHNVNSARDKLTVPKAMVADVHDKMEAAWDEGERNAQSLAREARSELKAVTLSIGVKAEAFGDAAEHAVELSGDIIKGAVETASSELTAAGTKGASMFDKVKNSLGQLPNKAGSLFTKMSASKFVSTIKDNLKWIVIAVVVLVVAVLAIKFM